jgi:hypothetical protein
MLVKELTINESKEKFSLKERKRNMEWAGP